MTLRDVAFHEAGHGVAVVWAWRTAEWLPKPPPSPVVRYVEITDSSGSCGGANIYSCAWSEDRLTPRYRPLMEAQIGIHLSGGIAEALARGARSEVLAFAIRHCNMGTDLTRARAVLGDLRTLTGVRFELQTFALRTRGLLEAHWGAVQALAAALFTERRIEGEDVERIIARAG